MSGQYPSLDNVGPLRPTTVGGVAALIADFQGPNFKGEIIVVDYGTKNYSIDLTAEASQFDRLRGGDFAAMLASWHWH